MQVTIIEHDKIKGLATIKFEHNDVIHEQNYDLKYVVPGTDLVLKAYGLEFTEQMQQQVIDKLTAQVQREIEAGFITNSI